MNDFYPWNVADLNFPAALKDQSVLSNTLDVAAQNDQMKLLAATSSWNAKDTTENSPKRKKLSLLCGNKQSTNTATIDKLSTFERLN